MKTQGFATLSALVATRLGLQWEQRSLPSKSLRPSPPNSGKPTRCKSQHLPQPQHFRPSCADIFHIFWREFFTP